MLSKEFYLQDTLTVAQQLIGKILVTNCGGEITAGRIIETEAYLGFTDKACHSYNKTPFGRTNIMYETGGKAYIYLIYGMYYCFNVVTCQQGQPEAVLIRALEPLAGTDIMSKRRHSDKITNFCSGPGKLCQAMGIDKTLYGEDLTGSKIYITAEMEGMPALPNEDLQKRILATKRINIDYAEEAKDFYYRFIVKNSPYLSVKPKRR